MKHFALKYKGDLIIIALMRFFVNYGENSYQFEDENSADNFIEEKKEKGFECAKVVINTESYNHLDGVEVKNLEEAQSLFDAIDTLDGAKAKKMTELKEYDKSDAVNQFFLNNMPIWLYDATRISLRNRIETENAAGKTKTTLWIGATSVELPIAQVEVMLQTLEIYAISCFDNTAKHKAAIMKLTTIKAVQEYDFTKGYPDKIKF